jgi:DedD protein
VPAKPPAVPAVVEPKPAAAEPPSSAKEAPAKESPKGEPKEDSKPVKKAAAKPAAKQAKPAAKSDGKFVVQVIALADAGKAKQMQESIAAAGINSYTEVVKTSKGDVTRVRAGPFASRAAAEKAREQLKALGMNGNITTR